MYPQRPISPDILDFPKVRQFSKRLKTILIITTILLLTIAILFYLFIIHPSHQVETLHAKYSAVIRPSTYAQVLQTMGVNPTSDEPGTTGDFTAYWDDEYPSPNFDESSKITHVVMYSIPKFPFGITFEFTFDKDQNLIGKHRYD